MTMKQLLFFYAFLVSSCFYAQEYSRAKIFTNSKGLQTLAELGIAIDHGEIKKDYSFTSDFSTEELQLIQEAGFEIEILIPDVVAYYIKQNQQKGTDYTTKNSTCTNTQNTSFSPTIPSNFQLGSMGGFYTYQEFLDELDSMASLYPNLITIRDTIQQFTSIQGRPIYWVRISDFPNLDENEPEVLYTAVHHAREPNSLSEVIFYMWYLLENYDSNPEVKALLDSTEMYFVPMVNPDGYIYNETNSPNGGGMWRKNRRLNSGGSYGVDLNRNYSYGWGTTGTSSTQSNDTYCGTAAFSEPETQAIKWFCENRDFKFAFNAHTYGNDILFPIGTTTAEFAEDHDYLNTFSGHMTKYNGYTHMKSSSLYPASGDSDDYMYKMDTVIKPKIFALTPEVSNTSGGFWPASSEITEICRGMVYPNLVLSHLTHRFFDVKDTDPQRISNLTGNFNHQATRLGLEDGAVSVSITPIQGIQSVGPPVPYTLNLMQQQIGAIGYVLNSSIQFDDEIVYVLNTEYPSWTHHDTIRKVYGAISSQSIDPANSLSNWVGTWGLSTSTYYSASSSFADSPSGNYSNNANKPFQYSNQIDLTNATAAAVKFYAKWDIEENYDFCQFQVSTDNGSTWIGQCGNYTVAGVSGSGSVQPNGKPIYEGVSDWVLEEISLSEYLGETILVRFLLKSDFGTTGDGFYFDDFELLINSSQNELSEMVQNGVHVYPNPSKQQTTITFNQVIDATSFELINSSGQLVLKRDLEKGTSQIQLITQSLSNGVYFLKLKESTRVENPIKIIVSK